MANKYEEFLCFSAVVNLKTEEEYNIFINCCEKLRLENIKYLKKHSFKEMHYSADVQTIQYGELCIEFQLLKGFTVSQKDKYINYGLAVYSLQDMLEEWKFINTITLYGIKTSMFAEKTNYSTTQYPQRLFSSVDMAKSSLEWRLFMEKGGFEHAGPDIGAKRIDTNYVEYMKLLKFEVIADEGFIPGGKNELYGIITTTVNKSNHDYNRNYSNTLFTSVAATKNGQEWTAFLQKDKVDDLSEGEDYFLKEEDENYIVYKELTLYSFIR